MKTREETLTRVRALLARATHETTGEEEARTSAFLAVKLIASSSLLDADASVESSKRKVAVLEQRLAEAGMYLRRTTDEIKRLNVLLTSLRNDKALLHEEVARVKTEAASFQAQVATLAAAVPKTANGSRNGSRNGAKPGARDLEKARDERDIGARPPGRPAREARSYRLITAKFGGRCKACDERYNEGAEVAWVRAEGTTHKRCRSYWDGGNGDRDRDRDDLEGAR